MLAKTSDQDILTQRMDPFFPARVDAVSAEITIGDDHDLSSGEKGGSRELADCFALSLSKMLVEGAAHKANTSDGFTFRRKVNQRPLSIPQREFFNRIIEDWVTCFFQTPLAMGQTGSVTLCDTLSNELQTNRSRGWS